MSKYEELEIPPFLRRTAETKKPAAEVPVSNPPVSDQPPEDNTDEPLSKKRALTSAFKDRIAGDIISAVKNGHTTFGQIRKVVNYDDREIKAGIRHARKWRSFLDKVDNGRKRANFIPKKARIELHGKQYRVVIA